MIVRLQTGENAVVLRVIKERQNDCLDKLLGKFYEILVAGERRVISAIDITEVLD
tara:strand:- start:1141 stop:1305 length:165 start_codon:yes stop_codon:yes gene_type:complete